MTYVLPIEFGGGYNLGALGCLGEVLHEFLPRVGHEHRLRAHESAHSEPRKTDARSWRNRLS